MTTRPPYPDTGQDADADADAASDPHLTTGAPRWVKVIGIIVLALGVLFVGMKVTGVGPDHGTGRHGGGGGTPASGATNTGGPRPE